MIYGFKFISTRLTRQNSISNGSTGYHSPKKLPTLTTHTIYQALFQYLTYPSIHS